MQTYKQSNLSLDEYIRLNDIKEPHILDASDVIAEQETIALFMIGMVYLPIPPFQVC